MENPIDVETIGRQDPPLPPGNQNELGSQVCRLTELDLVKWENELLKREKALSGQKKCSSCCGSMGDAGNKELSSMVDSTQMKIGINEVKTLIREFNPSHSSVTARNWIESIEGLKSLYEWDDRNTLFYATLRLGGAAYYWHQANQGCFRTFEEFKTELCKSFPTGQDNASILMRIMERRWLPGEAIEDYVYQVAALARSINLNESTTIRYLISGLSNPNLANVLLASNCSNIPELLKTIKNFDEIQKQRQARSTLYYKNQASTSKNVQEDHSKHYAIRNQYKQLNK